MSIQLNHTIVWCRDAHASSRFFAEILGLPAPRVFGVFQVVTLANAISLDFHATQDPITPQHYAFLISENEFDSSFARIRQQNLQYWADPARRRPGEINHNDGGRGVYFLAPDQHFLEIITRPYAGHG